MQRILIVEDDIEIQDMLRNHLTDAGYEVVIAEDGVTGIAKFDDTIKSSSTTITLPYFLIIKVTPSIIEEANPLFTEE